jgi:hypothetical protein
MVTVFWWIFSRTGFSVENGLPETHAGWGSAAEGRPSKFQPKDERVYEQAECRIGGRIPAWQSPPPARNPVKVSSVAVPNPYRIEPGFLMFKRQYLALSEFSCISEGTTPRLMAPPLN